MIEVKDCRIQVHVMAGERIELVLMGIEGSPQIGLTPSASRAIAEALVQAAAMVENAQVVPDQMAAAFAAPSGAKRLAKLKAGHRKGGPHSSQANGDTSSLARRFH